MSRKKLAADSEDDDFQSSRRGDLNTATRNEDLARTELLQAQQALAKGSGDTEDSQRLTKAVRAAQDNYARALGERTALHAKLATGRSLRSLRLAADLTIEKLAAKADVGRMTVVRYELGLIRKKDELIKLLETIERELEANAASAKGSRTPKLIKLILGDLRGLKTSVYAAWGVEDLRAPHAIPMLPIRTRIDDDEGEVGSIGSGAEQVSATDLQTSVDAADPEAVEIVGLLRQLGQTDRLELLGFIRGFVNGRKKSRL